MTKYDDFLAEYPPIVRLPLAGEDPLIDHGSQSDQNYGLGLASPHDVLDYAPLTGLPGLPRRFGLQDAIIFNNGEALESGAASDSSRKSGHFILEIQNTYDGVATKGLWSDGGSTNGSMMYIEDGVMHLTVAVSALFDSGVSWVIPPGPATYVVGYDQDNGIGDELNLYIDGVLVDSFTTTTARVNGAGDPRICSAGGRREDDTAVNHNIDPGDGLFITEFLIYQGQLTAAQHLAFYDAVAYYDAVPVHPTDSVPSITIGTGIPSQSIIDQFEGDITSIVTYVDIYEQDGTTLYAEKVGITEGTVSVDMSRAERRNLDITFHDDDDESSMAYGPGGFWYDKIIRPYRGIKLSDGTVWVHPLGCFHPDAITRPRFPTTMQASCRDNTKVLLDSKFAVTTTFSEDTNIGTLVQNIATNGGITSFNFQTTDKVTAEDITFERGVERWTACNDLAASAGHEIFFDAYGAMVFRPYVDPVSAPVSYNFRAGDQTANLAEFTRSTNDSFLKNDIIVHGDSEENAFVYARATNTNDLTSTSVNNIGRRMRVIPQQFVQDDAAAQVIADSFLSVSALEQYDMTLDALVIPWLETGEAVTVDVPDAAVQDPTRYLLASISIPLGMGTMSANAKRVILLG